jgi:hypothetical protein
VSPKGESAFYNAESYAFFGAQKCTNLVLILAARQRRKNRLTASSTSTGLLAATKASVTLPERAHTFVGLGRMGTGPRFSLFSRFTILSVKVILRAEDSVHGLRVVGLLCVLLG